MILQKILLQTNKISQDFKNFDFELIRYFSMSSPITEAEFKCKTEPQITSAIYKAAYEHYKEKMERTAAAGIPCN